MAAAQRILLHCQWNDLCPWDSSITKSGLTASSSCIHCSVILPRPTTDGNFLSPFFQASIDEYNCTIPHAKFFTDIGDLDAAAELYFPRRNIMRSQQKYQIRTSGSGDFRGSNQKLLLLDSIMRWSRKRIHSIHSMKVAEGAGLICIAYEWVLGTIGISDYGAGTHEMAFQKA